MSIAIDIDGVTNAINFDFEQLVEKVYNVRTIYEDTIEPERGGTIQVQPTNAAFYRVQVEVLSGRSILIGATRVRSFGVMTVEVFALPGRGPSSRNTLVGNVLGVFLRRRTANYAFVAAGGAGNQYEHAKLAKQGARPRSLLTLPFQFDCT